MSRNMTMTARRGWGMAAAAAATAAAAVCVSGTPALARAATASAPGIRPAACQSRTFNVDYGANRMKCYTGIGMKSVRIPDVHWITTGANRGFFIYEAGRGDVRVIFTPHKRITFPAVRHDELIAVDIV